MVQIRRPYRGRSVFTEGVGIDNFMIGGMAAKGSARSQGASRYSATKNPGQSMAKEFRATGKAGSSTAKPKSKYWPF